MVALMFPHFYARCMPTMRCHARIASHHYGTMCEHSIRHPLGAANFFLRKKTQSKWKIKRPGRFEPEELAAKQAKMDRIVQKKAASVGQVGDDCGYNFIRHWLFLHRGLSRDMPCLKNAGVLQFEQFLGVNNQLTQG